MITDSTKTIRLRARDFYEVIVDEGHPPPPPTNSVQGFLEGGGAMKKL